MKTVCTSCKTLSLKALLPIAILLISVAAQAELPSSSAEVITKALASGKPTMLDLGARSCVPCKQMAPILESLSGEYRDRANVLFVDVYDDRDVSNRFKVRMIPTQIFFNQQGKEVKRHLGFMGKAEILKELQAAGLK
ncbi:MAG: thioredoxin family protein [Geobacter sp.]|nr:thioredoxin family protein [Geobacter sp.]